MENPHLNILVQLAKIDGQADGSELEVIRKIGASKNVTSEDVEKAIEMAEAGDPIPSLSHFSEEEKFDLIYNLVLVMNADGIMHKEEMKFCFDMVQKLGFKGEMFFEMVSNTNVNSENKISKEDLIRRAKKFLK